MRMKKALFAQILLAFLTISIGIATLRPAFERTRIRHLASQVLEDARALDQALARFRSSNPEPTTVSLPLLLPFLDPGTRVAMSSGKDIFGREYVVGPLISDGVKVSQKTRNFFPENLVPKSIWAGYD